VALLPLACALACDRSTLSGTEPCCHDAVPSRDAPHTQAAGPLIQLGILPP